MWTELWWEYADRRKPKYSEKNLHQSHFVHHKSHMNYSGHHTSQWLYVMSLVSLRTQNFVRTPYCYPQLKEIKTDQFRVDSKRHNVRVRPGVLNLEGPNGHASGQTCTSVYARSALTFRHRASCILGQAFHYSPGNAFYIFNQQIHFIIWYLLDRASLI